MAAADAAAAAEEAVSVGHGTAADAAAASASTATAVVRARIVGEDGVSQDGCEGADAKEGGGTHVKTNVKSDGEPS